MEKLLDLKNIDKSFSGIKVLQNVNFDLYKGEVVCLVGENGAGKSTLIKILSGAESPDSGSIEILGEKFDKINPSLAIKKGIATIYQDVDLVDTLSVADNVFQGEEILKNGFFIDKKEQEKRTKSLLNRLSMNILPNEIVENLSPAQKQNLQILKALHKDASVLIMDEPTASLGEEETQALMSLVEKIKQQGIGIIYISHYFEEIFKIGDRAVVLKDGKYICTRNIKETTQSEVIKDMVGRDTSSFYQKNNFSTNDNSLSIKNLSSKYVTDVSFSVSRGEVFGLGGIVGAGRSELVRAIYGDDKIVSGEILLDGKKINSKNPKQAIDNKICFLSEERKAEGLFLVRSVKENIMLPLNEDKFFLNLKKEDDFVSNSIKQLNIKVFNNEQEVGKLSGGNQQKVVITRLIKMDADIYILDEPSKGVDVSTREEIYKAIEALVRLGKIVIIVSSYMPEILSLSDRIGVMRNGKLHAIVDAKKTTEDALLKLYIGIED